jgi:hypothetical protein
VIDHEWVAKAAGYMVEARPDLWDQYSAEQTLYEWIAELGEHDNGCAIGSGSFMLFKEIDENAPEGEQITYALNRNIVDICTYNDESTPNLHRGFDWISNSNKNNRDALRQQMDELFGDDES